MGDNLSWGQKRRQESAGLDDILTAGIKDESGKMTIEEELDDAPTVDRDLETAEKLFNTIGDQDE